MIIVLNILIVELVIILKITPEEVGDIGDKDKCSVDEVIDYFSGKFLPEDYEENKLKEIRHGVDQTWPRYPKF